MGGEGGSREEQPGSSVLSSRPCHARCANEATSGPGSLAGHGWGHCGSIEKRDSGHSTSLWVVTSPFSWGLYKVDCGAVGSLLFLSSSLLLVASAHHWLFVTSARRWLFFASARRWLFVASAHRWLFTRGWCATETCLFRRTSVESTLPRALAK